MLENAKTYLGEDWEAVSSGMRAYLETGIELLSRTNESLLAHSGKQLRPMLGLLAGRACSDGKANDDTIKYAIATELLHNATLLHDDVADESDKRRGEPTVRALLGPSASVLVGDFWLVKAVKAVLDCKNGCNSVIRLFSETLSNLAEGEMLQLQKAMEADTTEKDYYDIIHLKTASLFVTAAKAAAISVMATDEQKEAVSEYGRCLGMAFQIRDDILDYLPQGNIGKPVGVDLKEKKITLPLLCAFRNTDAEEEAQIREKIKSGTAEMVEEVTSFVSASHGIEGAQTILEEYIDKAIASIQRLSPSKDRDLLVDLALKLSYKTE